MILTLLLSWLNTPSIFQVHEWQLFVIMVWLVIEMNEFIIYQCSVSFQNGICADSFHNNNVVSQPNNKCITFLSSIGFQSTFAIIPKNPILPNLLYSQLRIIVCSSLLIVKIVSLNFDQLSLDPDILLWVIMFHFLKITSINLTIINSM